MDHPEKKGKEKKKKEKKKKREPISSEKWLKKEKTIETKERYG